MWASLQRLLLIASFVPLFTATQVFSQSFSSAQANTKIGDARDSASRTGLLRQFSNSLEDLSRVSPAVVQIQASGLEPVEGKSGGALIVQQRSIASGVIVDADGYIVTNAHVLEGAQQIRVVLPMPTVESPLQIPPVAKQQILDAKLIGTHRETDLALLKVEGHNFPTLP